MKNLIRIFLIVSACMMLSGCSDIGAKESGNADNETFTVAKDMMEEGIYYVYALYNIENMADIADIYDLPDGDSLDAIFYNGECYYGLAMSIEFKGGEEPEGFTYIGKISSVKEGYESPTEELETTVPNYEVGEDVYYYVDEDGRYNFCIPKSPRPDNCMEYKGIYYATTRKPTYYDR